MQCICGAHWCYYCQKPINECGGNCDERPEDSEADEESSDEDGDEDEDLDEEGDEEEDAEPVDMITVVDENSGGGTVAPPPPIAADMDKNPTPVVAPPQPPAQPHRIVNLDAGGARLWADAGIDFGNEPEEDGVDQIWSCPHSLRPYSRPTREDDVNVGDMSKMECNKCFCKVRPHIADLEITNDGCEIQSPARQTSFSRLVMSHKTPGLKQREALDDMAMECGWCYLVICEKCSKKAQSSLAE